MGGAIAQKAASVGPRERVLEIGRAGKRMQRFIGKLLGEDAAEARARFLARQIARGRVELQADEFEAIGPGAAKALDGKREALLGMIGDGEHATGEVVPLRPQMQKRLLSCAADFPRQCGEHGYTAAILANPRRKQPSRGRGARLRVLRRVPRR